MSARKRVFILVVLATVAWGFGWVRDGWSAPPNRSRCHGHFWTLPAKAKPAAPTVAKQCPDKCSACTCDPKRIADLEQALATLESVKAMPGPRGKQGPPGRSDRLSELYGTVAFVALFVAAVTFLLQAVHIGKGRKLPAVIYVPLLLFAVSAHAAAPPIDPFPRVAALRPATPAELEKLPVIDDGYDRTGQVWQWMTDGRGSWLYRRVPRPVLRPRLSARARGVK